MPPNSFTSAINHLLYSSQYTSIFCPTSSSTGGPLGSFLCRFALGESPPPQSTPPRPRGAPALPKLVVIEVLTKLTKNFGLIHPVMTVEVFCDSVGVLLRRAVGAHVEADVLNVAAQSVHVESSKVHVEVLRVLFRSAAVGKSCGGIASTFAGGGVRGRAHEGWMGCRAGTQEAPPGWRRF